MNIFGMGPTEILLIVVIALIVFGPAKLPEIMGQVGRVVNDFRRATSQLSDEFNRTIQAELQETRAVVDEAKAAVTDTHTTVSTAFTGMPAPSLTAAPGQTGAAPNGTSAEPIINGTAPAQVTPPLADTSQWSWESTAATLTSHTSTASATTATDAPAPPAPPARPRRAAARDELLPPY